MTSPNLDPMANCFKKGSKVEISSNEDGFRGSWYVGTVIRPPKNVHKMRGKVLVEYETLMADEAGTRPLREELELVQLRPPPPTEGRRSFKFSEEVDAYYNEGWWEGIVVEVVGEDVYQVFFRGTREQIEFRGSELRVHREWVRGMWIPPLELGRGGSENEKISSSAEVKPDKEKDEHKFSQEEPVEVCFDGDGYKGAWFAATIVKMVEEEKYLVEYQTLRNGDDSGFLTEVVDSLHIRPCPPDVGLLDRFAAHEEVDAFWNDGWWAGVIARVLKDEKYSVFFRSFDETMKFKHSDLRVHQEWLNGKWVITPKATEL